MIRLEFVGSVDPIPCGSDRAFVKLIGDEIDNQPILIECELQFRTAHRMHISPAQVIIARVQRLIDWQARKRWQCDDVIARNVRVADNAEGRLSEKEL